MMMRLWLAIIFYISLKLIGSESKPLEHPLNEHSNRVDYGSQGDYKILHSKKKESFRFELPSSSEIIKRNNAEARANDEFQVKETTEINNLTDMQTSENIQTTLNNNLSNFDNNNNLLTTVLGTLLQKFQFSPQMFFQDRLNQLKQFLTNYGFIVPTDQGTAKQFPNINKLLNFIGLDDNGFYTDRLEAGGLLNGNGWFSNKGGLLGGPGAIISTGPLLTDYPTPYRKK